MYVPPEVKHRVAKKVNECIDKANLHFNRTYPIPTIHYDVRGTRGGYQERGELHFNPILLMENVEDFMERTVPHELAHWIDTVNGGNARPANDSYQVLSSMILGGRKVRRAKRSIHGPTWQHICRVLGMRDITRTHRYDVTNARVKLKVKFEYKCNNCAKTIFMSSVRHNKFRMGRSTYWCSACGRERGTLTLIRSLGQKTHEELIAYRAAQPKVHVIPNVPVASNIDRARKMYNMYSNLGRGVCIRKMVECGIKDTTASTYYQNFKSGK